MNHVLRWPTQMPDGGLLPMGKSIYDTHKGKVADHDAGCEQTLHISLFFDGTNNNDDKNNPFRDSLSQAHTNVARLYKAAREEPENGIYPHYMPGVGTPFPEIGESVYSSIGKAFAKGYGRRCVWGYTRVLNSIYAAIAGPQAGRLIEDDEADRLCRASADGYRPFATLFDMKHRRLAGMQRDRKRDCQRNKMVKQVWINVFGFSRGAATARSFVGKLMRDWPPGGRIAGEIPYQVNFMGLFDTVASVGPPDSVRAALDISTFDGHFAWSNSGLMDIPKEVKRCAHFFSIHEQRMSFPLDTIREGSVYPGGAGQRLEVAYPGVHSDIGGGYPPGDQGKARGGEDDKLSQIPLHHMYIEALKQGVPLFVGDEIKKRPAMQDDFALAKPVIDAFNRWLDRTIPIERVEDALRFGMRQNLAWRALRARWHTGDYVCNQPFFKAAQEDELTPRQLELRVQKQMESDAEVRRLRGRIAELAAARTNLGLAGAAGGYVSAADRAAQMKEAQALDKQSQQAADALRRRREQLYQQAAKKKGPTRPGEGADETVTNDQHDLREAAEEFRLLLGFLHPDRQTALGVEQSPFTVRPPAAGSYLVSPIGVVLAAYATYQNSGRRLSVRRERNADSERVQLVQRDAYVQTAALADFDAEKFDVLVLPPREMLDPLQAWTTAEVVDRFARQELAAVILFDDYIHDSRAWFRVPSFHEYAPGGYGWGRAFFIGKDHCVRHLGFGTDAMVKSITTAPRPTPAEMAMGD
ncbi:phospholipase effector Tle1 domain-containing protein [Cupriavidus malaysiensis]|uniref:T6SS Phospholipase effector Tle1-like catalytic domain-containing protein n=1 Tax=Cupriavidus malaysiensis TaxID=367825 RepID=A0A1D9ID66_9BURK|nr:DUF2235 domain-containing protein [Cupriavidus malaysiensis]AOZ09953.1 hypothetical protein BKK80_30230 [Cupriavidus malaysiensis]